MDSPNYTYVDGNGIMHNVSVRTKNDKGIMEETKIDSSIDSANTTFLVMTTNINNTNNGVVRMMKKEKITNWKQEMMNEVNVDINNDTKAKMIREVKTERVTNMKNGKYDEVVTTTLNNNCNISQDVQKSSGQSKIENYEASSSSSSTLTTVFIILFLAAAAAGGYFVYKSAKNY